MILIILHIKQKAVQQKGGDRRIKTFTSLSGFTDASIRTRIKTFNRINMCDNDKMNEFVETFHEQQIIFWAHSTSICQKIMMVLTLVLNLLVPPFAIPFLNKGKILPLEQGLRLYCDIIIIWALY